MTYLKLLLPPYQDVLDYLKEYTKHYELESMIRLKHRVIEVAPATESPSRLDSGGPQWRVTVENLDDARCVRQC